LQNEIFAQNVMNDDDDDDNATTTDMSTTKTDNARNRKTSSEF